MFLIIKKYYVDEKKYTVECTRIHRSNILMFSVPYVGFSKYKKPRSRLRIWICNNRQIVTRSKMG